MSKGNNTGSPSDFSLSGNPARFTSFFEDTNRKRRLPCVLVKSYVITHATSSI